MADNIPKQKEVSNCIYRYLTGAHPGGTALPNKQGVFIIPLNQYYLFTDATYKNVHEKVGMVTTIAESIASAYSLDDEQKSLMKFKMTSSRVDVQMVTSDATIGSVIDLYYCICKKDAQQADSLLKTFNLAMTNQNQCLQQVDTGANMWDLGVTPYDAGTDFLQYWHIYKTQRIVTDGEKEIAVSLQGIPFTFNGREYYDNDLCLKKYVSHCLIGIFRGPLKDTATDADLTNTMGCTVRAIWRQSYKPYVILNDGQNKGLTCNVDTDTDPTT